MKKKIVLLYILSEIFSFLLAFIYAVAFLKPFREFDKISDKTLLALSLVFGIIMAIVTLCVSIYRKNACKITRFWNWFDNSKSSFIILYLFSAITLSFIKSETIFSLEQIKNFISLQWTIFGITVTIFLVWNAIVLNNLKQKFPKPIQKQSILDKSHYINEKMQFYQDASFRLNSITFVIINLLVVVLSTGLAYVAFNEVNLINQNIAIVSFYLCTNTLTIILLDVLEPLIFEKELLLKKTKVSYAEVRQLNKFQETMSNTLIACAQIDDLENIDDSEKERMIKTLLSAIMEDISESDGVNQQSEGDE